MTTINAQTIINEVMQAHAVAPLNKDAGFFDKIKFQTAERGSHLIHNSQEHLQRFADLVRKNARFFGGGLDKVQKERASVSYPSKTLTMFKQLIEDKDYSAALDLADEKLSPLFYVCQKGQAFMQVAPVPCEFDARLVSVLNEGGKYSVIEPVSMCSVNGASYVQKGNRAGQLENVEQRFKTFSSESVETMFSNTLKKPADQAAIRTQWMIEHGIENSETIAARIESEELAREEEKTLGQRFDEERAKRKAEREALAAQDVAQVVANAVAAVAISEAMQPSEAGELVTCEAGDNEANAPSVGSASSAAWSPILQFSPCSPIDTGFGQSKPPAFRGDDMPEGGDDAPATPGEPSNPAPAATQGVEGVARSNLETERKQWQGFAQDIPASLAISAYNGVSMSPERRGASAQNEYGQTMAADYEAMRAQAVKGGTLDLLPEVFARYRSRQAGAYRAYLASSSRCVSSFIAGPSNFPAARMNKRSEIAHKRLGEYLNGGEMALQAACRTLRPDLRAIMAGDVDAIDRLTVDLNSAERLQNQMKAANKAIRTHAKAGEAHQVAALMELGHSEAQALELLHPRFSRGQGFPSYRLTNNQANIRRMRERLEKITAAKARPVETVECSNGVTLEDDAPANRVRLFFPGKPSEEIRTELKASGFRWAPSVGAWQAYRNYGTLATAKRLAGDAIKSAPVFPEEIQGGTGGLPVQIENETADVDAMTHVVGSTETPAPAVVEFFPKDTRISYSKIKRGTAFTLEINGPVFVKSVKGFRPGCGGELISVYSGMLVYPFNLDGTPTPPAVESQPVAAAPVVETEPTTYAERKAQIDKDYSHIPEGNRPPAFIYGEGLETWQMDASTFSQQSRDNPHWSQSYPCGDGDYLRDCFATHAAIVAAHEAQDVPAVSVPEVPAAQPIESGAWTPERCEYELSAQQATNRPTVQSKSGNWCAWLYLTGLGAFGMRFESSTAGNVTSTHRTAKERMTYLSSMAKAADAPTDTPPTGGLPCPDSQASNPTEKTEGWEGSPVQISTPEAVETFKQAGPVRVDLASMIVKGVAPEALIGLGVYCKGDMANPSGSGAITGFSHSDFYGLVVDVTLESGQVWRAVRTSEFLTGWFSLDAKMHGAPYLAQLAATVASLKASTSAAKEQAGNAHAKALIDLVAQYPQLKRAETSYAGGKLAAANMRILLKAAFKGVKFSVTSDYNSVRVNWEDGPTDDQVNEVVGRFDIGASDTQSDYFYTASTAFSELFGGVQYLHTRRHESDALVQQAINQMYPDATNRPTVQDWRKSTGHFSWVNRDAETRCLRELMNSTSLFSATKSHAKS